MNTANATVGAMRPVARRSASCSARCPEKFDVSTVAPYHPRVGSEFVITGGVVLLLGCALLDDFYDARARWLRLLGRQRHLGKSAPILTPRIYWSPRAMGIVCVVLGLAFLLTGMFMT
jgi:hypothetical protein